MRLQRHAKVLSMPYCPSIDMILHFHSTVLCYSVITSGEFAHRGSVENLIGNRTELLEKVSLEKHVSAQTPPAFLWASDNDPSVPCQNS